MQPKKTADNAGHKAAIRIENERLILQAAEHVFAMQGFKGATTGKIAEQAGMPKANVHYYFSTKKILYQRVIQDICDTWLESANLFDDLNNPKEALAAYINAKMELSRQRPLGSRIWANEMARGAQFTSEYIGTNVKSWLEGRTKVIQRWIDDGQIDPIDPRTLMYMIWATTQHYADFGTQIEILNENKPLSDAQFKAAKEMVTSIILKGVGAQGARP